MITNTRKYTKIAGILGNNRITFVMLLCNATLQLKNKLVLPSENRMLLSVIQLGRNNKSIAAPLNFTHSGDESSILFLPKMGRGIEVGRKNSAE